jgi:hypothetical protein
MICFTQITYTDGEVVIMLAFQASGTGSIPVRCIFVSQTASFLLLRTASACRNPFKHISSGQDSKDRFQKEQSVALLSLYVFLRVHECELSFFIWLEAELYYSGCTQSPILLLLNCIFDLD